VNNGIALMFYKDGVLIKQYSVQDLLRDHSKAIHSTTTVFWENYSKRRFDPDTNILHITANCGSEYGFDLNTGAIVLFSNIPKSNNNLKSNNNPKNKVTTYIIGGIVGFVVILLIITLAKR
jgi:hypothetical protein